MIDVQEVIREYGNDRTAVRRLAIKYGVSIQAIYYQLQKAGLQRRHGGDASKGTQYGDKSPSWRGGRRIVRGYVLIWIDGHYEYEHRMVMERVLGRKLLDTEVVHHINGAKADNRPENLEVTIQSVHAREHMTSDVARAKALMAPKKTHCIRGHEFTPENTYRDGKGRRRCIACVRKYRKEWGAANGR